MQPMWVHTAVKHLNSPSSGWVTTTRWSGKMTPPPNGTSAVLVSGPARGLRRAVTGVERVVGVSAGLVPTARGQHGGADADSGGDGQGATAIGLRHGAGVPFVGGGLKVLTTSDREWFSRSEVSCPATHRHGSAGQHLRVAVGPPRAGSGSSSTVDRRLVQASASSTPPSRPPSRPPAAHPALRQADSAAVAGWGPTAAGGAAAASSLPGTGAPATPRRTCPSRHRCRDQDPGARRPAACPARAGARARGSPRSSRCRRRPAWRSTYRPGRRGRCGRPATARRRGPAR